MIENRPISIYNYKFSIIIFEKDNNKTSNKYSSLLNFEAFFKIPESTQHSFINKNMLNPIQIKATLSLYLPQKLLNNPLIFPLKQGETIFGSDNILCNYILDLPEIEQVQAKISIYEYGECSFESLSDHYNNFKEYEMIPGHKHLLKMRKNKEYDIFNGSIFYISKYRALFNVEFIEIPGNLHRNMFMSTLFVPDRELVEEDDGERLKKPNKHHKLDFLPTQNLEIVDNEEEKKNNDRSREIRNIFQQAVEKIKKNCREKNQNNSSMQEKEDTDDVLSKFVNLFDSMKEEITANSKLSQTSQYSNSNSKGISTAESPNLKAINFKGASKSKMKENFETQSSMENDNKNEALKLTKNFIKNPNLSPISFSENPIEKKPENELKSNNIFINKSPENQNKIIVEENFNERSQNIINEQVFEPTIRQSQVPLSAAMQESEIKVELAPTIQESQLGNDVMAPTLRESQMGNNILAATIRESQIVYGPTIRESQIPESTKKLEKMEFAPTAIQSEAFLPRKDDTKNEEKMKKYIRDSKRNVKKRKIELPELIQIEKKKNLEKKIQEEQFQSLKLFSKDNIDDLDDLFEKEDSIRKEKKEESFGETQNGIQELNLNFGGEREKGGFFQEKCVKFEEKENKKAIIKKKIPKKILKNIVQEEEKKTNDIPMENQNAEIKKPKLYLSQKTFNFTSNESLNLSSKKAPPKKKKAFVEESEDEDDNNEESSVEGENLYQLHLTKTEEPEKNDEINNVHGKLLNESEKKEDSGTERLNSEKENDKETDKNLKDDEDKKVSVDKMLNMKKKAPIKNATNSKKLLGNLKITKTLTQIFSSQSAELDAVLFVSFGGFKPTKKEVEGLKELKIEIIDDFALKRSDVLVINKLKKEPYLLMAINKGINVISRKWLDDTLAAKSIQIMDAYHFKDTDFERENNIFLDQMILKAKLQGGLLNGYKIWLNCKKDLRGVIESAGGVTLAKMPEKNEEKTLIILDETKRRLIIDLAEKNIPFYFPDFLIEACLKQELVL